ncbi:MAG: hypothetical protein J1E05_07840 [Eubacterium sp.]|nr:hypothetical protein [Eubacterium sp.]
MTEVYSVLNQAPADDLWFIPVIFGVFGGVFFLALLFSLYKMITTQNIFIGKIVLHVFAMGFAIVWLALFFFGFSGEKRMYEEYCEALESNTYLVESGTPSRLDYYPYDDEEENTVYEVSFWINGKYFDSGYAYEGTFSESDLELIKNSETVEVKYIVDEENENIILSMSVLVE